MFRVLLVVVMSCIPSATHAVPPPPSSPTTGPSVTIVNPPSDPVPVAVGNLPLATDGSLKTSSAQPKLRWGHAVLSLESGFQRRLAIPEGVVLTDFVLGQIWGDYPCNVWFYALEANAMGPVYVAHMTQERPVVELHLQTGVRSTAETEFGFFVNASCRIDAFWTGYEG